MHRTQFNRALLVACLVVVVPQAAGGQSCERVSKGRVAVIAGAYAAAETAALLARHEDWWTTPTRSFHFRDLASPSKEQDKLLHAAIGYQISQLGALAWDWACVSRGAAGWLGAALGFAVGLPKEIGDGFHENKGFSAVDMAWTAVGATLPALHRTWEPSRVVALKVWYWPSEEYRNRTGPLPQLENDYAGQRYFVTFHPGALPGGAGRWPDWLGVGLGHSVPHWATVPPVNEWFVSLDVRFRGIPIRAEWWRTVATLADQIHFPSPGIRLREGELAFGLF